MPRWVSSFENRIAAEAAELARAYSETSPPRP